MTAVATASSAEQLVARRGALASAVSAAPLLSAYVVLALVYAWQAVSHGSPWLFSDEVEYADLSRAIGASGEPAIRGESADPVSLYTYLLAPVWFIDDPETAYSAAKYLGVFVMTSAVFPAYGLARLLVPRLPAFLAAIATAVVPMMAYSRLLVTEVLAYPVAVLAFFLIAKAIVTRSRYWIAAALLALVAVDDVRKQFYLFWAIAAIAIGVSIWLSPAARRWRGDWGVVKWGAAALGLALLVQVGHRIATHNGSGLYYIATTLPDRMRDFSIWALGAFVIGIGVFPAILALAALWRPREASEPGYRAVVGVFIGALVTFGLYTVVKAVYLSTVYGNVVSERNLVFLAPLVFALAAFFIHRPGGHPLVLAGATAAVSLLVVKAPYNTDRYPYFDAPGLSVLSLFNRHLFYDDAMLRRILVWIAIGTLLAASAALLSRGRVHDAWRGVLALAAVAVIGWNAAGEASFGNGINGIANRLRASVPDPPYWVDNVTKGGETMFVGQAITTFDINPILLTEFWNRSVQHVGSLDGTAPGPGPAPVLVPYTRDGRVVNDPGVEYVLTNSPGVEVEGELVYSPGGWELYRVDGPIRLRSSVTGVSTDGWTGGGASYNRFGSGERGTVDVHLSRKFAPQPGKITIHVGSLKPEPVSVIRNPCQADVCRDYNPKIDEVFGNASWTAKPGEERTFRFPVVTPFRVEVTVDPTFRPADHGGSDLRSLGAQAAFAFKSAEG